MYSKKETLDFLAYLKNALSENSLATTEAEMYNYQRSELQIIKESDSSKTAYELLGKGHCTSISPDYETVDYVPFADIYYREDCYDYLISEGISVGDACRLTTIIRMGAYERKGKQLFGDKLPGEFNRWACTITYLGSRSTIFESFYREYEEFKFKNKCNIPEIKINRNDVDSIFKKIISDSPEVFYNHDIIKINCSTNDENNNEFVVTDYIAGKLLKNNILENIKFSNTADKTTYLSESLCSKPMTNSSSYNYHNEKISIDLYNCHQYNECYLYVADYQIPINSNLNYIKNQSIIDLVSVNPERREVYLMKLKTPDNTDSLLSCVTEIYTYFKQIDKVQLTREIGKKYEFRLTGLFKVIPAIIVFEGSEQHLQLRSSLFRNVQKLMLKLGVKFFITKDDRGLFIDRDNVYSIIEAPVDVMKET